jgi:hypothetical protein
MRNLLGGFCYSLYIRFLESKSGSYCYRGLGGIGRSTIYVYTLSLVILFQFGSKTLGHKRKKKKKKKKKSNTKLCWPSCSYLLKGRELLSFGQKKRKSTFLFHPSVCKTTQYNSKACSFFLLLRNFFASLCLALRVLIGYIQSGKVLPLLPLFHVITAAAAAVYWRTGGAVQHLKRSDPLFQHADKPSDLATTANSRRSLYIDIERRWDSDWCSSAGCCASPTLRPCKPILVQIYRKDRRVGIIDRHWAGLCIQHTHSTVPTQYTVGSESDDEWSAQETYIYSRMANRIH